MPPRRRRWGKAGAGGRARRQRTVTLGDEVLDELVRERERLADRHAEADEVFGVHGCRSFENGKRSMRTHFECAAVFVLFVERIQPGKTSGGAIQVLPMDR